MYLTGNPIGPEGSNDPRDLSDNAQIIDVIATDTSKMETPSRLGDSLTTVAGLKQMVIDYLAAQGFEAIHLQYVDGQPLTVLRPTQLIDRGGSVYRVRMPSNFPLTLTGTWSADAPRLVDVGDAALRQALAANGGAAMVGTASGETVQAVLDSKANHNLSGSDSYSEANVFESTEIVLTPPVGFPWSPGFAIYRDRGGDFKTSADASSYFPVNPTTVLYVDCVSGLDTNSGLTSSLPKKTLSAALGTTAYTGTSGACIIYLGSGFYSVTESFNGIVLTRETALVCPSGKARLTSGVRGNALSWAAQASPNTNVYRATPTAAALAVFDAPNGTDDGYMRRYVPVASVAECQATPGSFYNDGTFVYVRTIPGGSPGSGIYISLDSNLGTRHTSSHAFFAENISFELGRSFDLTGGENGSRVVFSKCDFKYMSGNGLTSVSRRSDVLLFNCLAGLNGRDGFNYEYRAEGYRVLEVNCRAELNGFVTTGTNNGSTCHGDTRIIRVNCFYDRNADRNVHDIENTHAWNIGCFSGRTTNGGTGNYESFNFGAGRRGSPDATRMWIDSCTCQGSAVDLYSGDGATIYTRRMKEKTKAGAGQFSQY